MKTTLLTTAALSLFYAVIAWNLCDPFFPWCDRPVPGRCTIVELAR